MPEWGELGMSTAASAAGGILGLALGGINDARQINQQEKLQKLQIEGQKEMTDYSYGKQLQMWKDTSYGAQKEQMQKAGINPALMYGMGGGGGQSTGSPGATNVTGGNAPSGGGEAMGMSQQTMQMSMMEAQRRVLETQADKNAADAAKTAGVDTQKAETEISSLTQGITNAQVTEKILNLEKELKTNAVEVSDRTVGDQIDAIKYTTSKLTEEFQIAANEANFGLDTMKDREKIIAQQATEAVLNVTYKKAQINKTEADIKKIANDIVISQGELGVEQFEAQTQLTGVAGRLANDALDAIFKALHFKREGRGIETHTITEHGKGFHQTIQTRKHH